MRADLSEAFMYDAQVSFRRAEPMETGMGSRAADRAAAAATDLLMALLSLQRVDGGFDLDDVMLSRLGIEPAQLSVALAGLPGDPGRALRVLHTAVVLAVLEARFADARETWFAAVRKSRAWLQQVTDGWGQVMGGKSVSQWAKEVAAAPV
jgi:hypothetical protein